jgi:uncharacterized protein YfaS (alpha-2-macroglobulin family)
MNLFVVTMNFIKNKIKFFKVLTKQLNHLNIMWNSEEEIEIDNQIKDK